MSATDKPDNREPLIGARVSDEMKRKAEMRAREKGLNTTEYLIGLIEDDLADAPYLEDIEFE